MTDTNELNIPNYVGVFEPIPESEWYVMLLSGPSPLIFRPHEGQEPNWLWRKTQYWAFGLRWVKGPYSDGE